MKLPQSLWLLVTAALAAAQTRQTLSLEKIQAATKSQTFTIPAAANLTVSVAVCDTGTSPTFFVTNSSSNAQDPGHSAGTDIYQITLENGMGNFTGSFASGGVLSVETSNPGYEVAVSEFGPMHRSLALAPLLGDTTNNQAIIFSPSVAKTSYVVSTYPNYTLPAANTSLPDASVVNETFRLLVTKTANRPTLLSGCALRAASENFEGTVVDERLWHKDLNGWRNQYILDGLSPQTNYSAYVVIDEGKVSGPLSFVTKSSGFACSLLSSLPYCPNIAYAVPLPAPANSDFGTYNATNLPSSISEPLLSSITNFTTTLTTFACGRDMYSPLVTCQDCQREYRRWLCTVSFPRCGESSPTSSGSTTTDGAQQVFSALAAQSTSATRRNENFPTFGTDYEALLPCLERCNAVDRACPTFLGFQCPTKQFGAKASYGVGYVDSGEDGEEGGGSSGRAQDRYGNVWCNWG
ncbi:hypothetical protein CYLTODRAFT_436665 [Cylindrobasidium torrendii FP15055 ss-10]|uniref:FZ domain-containing protein n=1 Tax=Cylindrobasidium torrendii FP15055 ss-10 TaxID=1314674 RepID=A0A0D7BCR9_9AGAR|nr:hypothetical protein CYLTODRAFT_436665 [Cylindrobasidium torrendii FP15055 ss-10]